MALHGVAVWYTHVSCNINLNNLAVLLHYLKLFLLVLSQVSVVDELGIPVKFVGVGEGMEDLQPFDAEAFVEAIFP